MAMIGCSTVTSSDFPKLAIDAIVVSTVGTGGESAAGVWMEACPSYADVCVSSSKNIDLSGLVSPHASATCSYPIIVDV